MLTTYVLYFIFYLIFEASNEIDFGSPGKEPACRHRRYKRRVFHSWVRKIPGV